MKENFFYILIMGNFLIAVGFLIGFVTNQMDVIWVEETKVPIIMFHYVREVDRSKDFLGYNLSISPQKFEEQLKYLKNKGYSTIHLKDLRRKKIQKKSVILTFDDGTEDFYTTALPLLTKYGFKASNAIISGKIGKKGYMTEEQIKESISSGTEIISHTADHHDLSRLSRKMISEQILESRKILEAKFDIKIESFCYPVGKYNETVLEVLREENYLTGITVNYGVADLSKNDFLLLPRIRMDNRYGLKRLKQVLEDSD